MLSRKITYHLYKFYEERLPDTALYQNFDFEDFITFLHNLNPKERKKGLSDSKFCSLDFIEDITSDSLKRRGKTRVYFGAMKSAIYGSKKDLLDSETNEERENDKKVSEGEKELNYFILAFDNNAEFDIIYQTIHNGVTAYQFYKYLETYIDRYIIAQNIQKNFVTSFGDVIVNNPKELIHDLHRVVECKIYMDKKILGSDFLNISERTYTVKDYLKVDVTADIKKSIDGFAIDCINGLKNDRRIDKIWIRGKDSESNESKFFIEKIQKSKFLKVEIDPIKRTLKKSDVKTKMISLIN
ncbi:hypothetical protein SAMN04487907_101238 [Zunongwangia mangrovi]|uniref:Uncharacterized protein n=1 Tax=Zunongwangia mangrovi TaxID=1334022 RepID=A0A1I1DA13_9FLAO|nr:hypothetical protein [Zunongwangia mangrovi]SFB71781.1 hypothetical protein SAMN04487907_101238 [Zunongwangia mangrovi]